MKLAAPASIDLEHGLPLSDPQVARLYQSGIGLARPPSAPVPARENDRRLEVLEQQVQSLRNELADTVATCDARVRSMALEAARARVASQARLRQTLDERDARIAALEKELALREHELTDLESIARQLQDLLRRKEVQLTEMMDEMRGLLRVALCTPSNAG